LSQCRANRSVSADDSRQYSEDEKKNSPAATTKCSSNTNQQDVIKAFCPSRGRGRADEAEAEAETSRPMQGRKLSPQYILTSKLKEMGHKFQSTWKTVYHFQWPERH